MFYVYISVTLSIDQYITYIGSNALNRSKFSGQDFNLEDFDQWQWFLKTSILFLYEQGIVFLVIVLAKSWIDRLMSIVMIGHTS